MKSKSVARGSLRPAAAMCVFALMFSPIAVAQTTVDASQRQQHASSFTVVQLPALDPSLLPNTVATTRPVPAKPDIELQSDPTPDLTYPYDYCLVRWVTVKNNGLYTELQLDVSVTGPEEFSAGQNQLSGPLYPQPARLFLQPGESQRVRIRIDWNELNLSAWSRETLTTIALTSRFPRRTAA